MKHLLQRPILGGVFGDGRYALASMPCISRGLHTTKYMVVDPRAGAVLSVAEDKVEALADARRVLRSVTELDRFEGNAPPVQSELWPVLPIAAQATAAQATHVSRRRREVFERTQGKCFYCSTPLQLAGPWHVEHQHPRALGGGDNPLNLVAACVDCNLRKGDRTALEFVSGSR